MNNWKNIKQVSILYEVDLISQEEFDKYFDN